MENEDEPEADAPAWKVVVRLPGKLAAWLRGEAKDADELPTETIRRVLREAREDDDEDDEPESESDDDSESEDDEDEPEDEDEAD